MQKAIGDFQGGISSFQALLDKLAAEVHKEREKLEQEKAQLAQDREEFEDESKRIAQVAGSDNEQVTLNVGGNIFKTTATTLKNSPAPSLFAAMFSGRHNLKLEKDGTLFIDRDGRHFHDILNFLRDGSFNYPTDGIDLKYLLELRAEAEYFGLTGLLEHIDRYPYSMTHVRRAGTLNLEDSWMYEDGQDEVVFSVDTPCQLLGAGLCGTEGAFTAELELLEVDPTDFSVEEKKLREAAQTFTKVDGQIVQLMLHTPAHLEPKKYYMLSALIKGTDSFCCEDCLDAVIAGGVRIQFYGWESPNGTNECRGQFPELYIRVPKL
ncbi:hypothetical protein WJX84_000334 [Apatococcus fuscideae]|uniref:BTB domain-containing protein n=1 Tax=Apatococcus fuscideae TaxID=2026836 RepID=A0AAW1T7C2_9CHLO